MPIADVPPLTLTVRTRSLRHDADADADALLQDAEAKFPYVVEMDPRALVYHSALGPPPW